MAGLHLSNGLKGSDARDYADLVAEITGGTLDGTLPFLAPALLFADTDAQARMGVPRPNSDEVLLHDYQAIRYSAPLPLDHPLDVSMQRSGHEFGIDLTRDQQPILRMDTALRVVAQSDLIGLKPTQFRAIERLANLGLTTDLSISQTQVSRYLALSGDTNPIHSDPEAAMALGLTAPIVPGVLLVSCIQPAIQSARPDAPLISLKVRFMAPITVGGIFQIALQDRGDAPEGQRLRAYLMTADAQALAVADLVFQSA